MNYLIYLTPLLFTISFVIYSKYQFEDMREGYAVAKRKWHPYGAFMRAMIFVAIIVEHFYPSNLWDIICSAVINIIAWDILINIIALHVKWDYEGSTAATDKRLGKIKWITYAALLVGSAIGNYFSHKNKKP